MLTPDQFAHNVKTRDETDEHVEFAIKLPGTKMAQPVWLPIDAKFPMEHYERLAVAQEKGDAEAVETAVRTLETQLKKSPKISAISTSTRRRRPISRCVFLPSEGLYAEAIRRVGLVEQRAARLPRHFCRADHAGGVVRISLQMGFRTLAIQKRSSEVWNLLAGVKTEFGKFGESFSAVKDKLDQAARKMEESMCVRVRLRGSSAMWKSCRAIPQPLLPELLQGDDEDGVMEVDILPPACGVSDMAV